MMVFTKYFAVGWDCRKNATTIRASTFVAHVSAKLAVNILVFLVPVERSVPPVAPS